jgi:hypothetical protein
MEYESNIGKIFEIKNTPLVANIVLSRHQKYLLLILFFVTVFALLTISNNIIPYMKEIAILISTLLVGLINASVIHRLVPLIINHNSNDFLFPDNEFYPIDENLPKYTILVPLYNEKEIIESTIRHLSMLEYPIEKLEIFLLIEKGDFETKSGITELPGHFRIIDIPVSAKRGKPRALNYGLEISTGDIITVYDAEDSPDKYQLLNALAAFEKYGDKVWAVQASLKFSNPTHNWLTYLFYAEYSFWYDIYLPFLLKSGYPIPLSGTSNHIRASELRKIGGWDEYNVTEDADLALRIYKNGGRIGLLKSTTIETPPTKIKNWIRQRTRWIKGLSQTFLVHSRGKQRINEIKYYLLCFGNIFLVIYIFLLTFIIATSDSYHHLISKVAVSAFIANLILTSLIYIKVLSINNIPIIYIWIFPGVVLYWLLYLYANFRAIYYLFTNTFYWEKTDHGKNG